MLNRFCFLVLLLAGGKALTSDLFAQAPELRCRETILLPDYNAPQFIGAKMLGGECPEGFSEIPYEEFPCRKFLRFEQRAEEIPVECPRRGRTNKNTSSKSAK